MTTSNPIRVYMVDDHRSVLEGIKAALLLTSDIHIVGSATDSVAALEEIGQRRNEIDIVLSDVGMPVMDGIELCRKLKSGGTLPYVILLTQYSEAEVRFRAVRADADGYVLKVAGIDEILACLRNVMNGSFAQFERSYHQQSSSRSDGDRAQDPEDDRLRRTDVEGDRRAAVPQHSHHRAAPQGHHGQARYQFHDRPREVCLCDRPVQSRFREYLIP